MNETRFLEAHVRMKHGKEREGQIANALKQQVGLNIIEASDDDDKARKVDRWLDRNGKQIALQIKYRETGEDLLFEVYDRWFDWDDHRNKVGRDMLGDAQLYAVLKTDKQTVVMVPTDYAKTIIREMIEIVQQHGWTVENHISKTFRFFQHGHKIELKAQKDPRDGRQKMVAYIPAAVFESEAQLETYKARLPRRWKQAA